MEPSDGDAPVDLEEALYTAVGLVILGVQRLQVARRDLAKDVRSVWERLADQPDRATDR